MTWLEGKKTYIAAGLLMVLGFFGFWTDKVNDVNSTAIIVIAFLLPADEAKKLFESGELDAPKGGQG